MESVFSLIDKGKFKNIDEHDFLNEISLRLGSNIELVNVIMETTQDNADLIGALFVLQRDIMRTNDCILKYLYND